MLIPLLVPPSENHSLSDDRADLPILSPSWMEKNAAWMAAHPVQLLVATVFTAAFARTFYPLVVENPIVWIAPAALGTMAIFDIARVFYGEHCLGLWSAQKAQEEQNHFAYHLLPTFTPQQNVATVNPAPWSPYFTAGVMLAAVASTFPLGLTKINLDIHADWLWLALEILYLLAYSVIDAAPHVMHLRLQHEAHKKFLTLSPALMGVALFFMAAHALGDSADLWNAPNLWLRVWCAIGLCVEAYLSHVEAIVHCEPHLPAVNTKCLVVIAAAASIGFCNWYNTYRLYPPNSSWEQIVFMAAQVINACFFGFEAWNHYPSSHPALKQAQPLLELDTTAVAESLVLIRSDSADTLEDNNPGTPYSASGEYALFCSSVRVKLPADFINTSCPCNKH